MKAMIYWDDRAEYFFRNPNNPNKPLKLYPQQKQIIRALQFGIDIKHPEYPPTVGVLVRARRQKLGKSTGVAAAAAAGMLDGNNSFGLFAHVEERSFDLMGRTQYFIETSPFPFLITQKSKQRVSLSNRAYSKSHAASASIEGGSFTHGIIDEAGRQEDKLLRITILPCFSEIGVHWMMIGTPRGARGVFIEFERLARNDIRSGHAPRFQVIYLDPFEGGRLDEKTLEFEKTLYGMFWRQEALGEIISAEGLYWTEEQIEFAMGNIAIGRHAGTPYHNSWQNRQDNVEYSIGIDFGLSTSHTVFVVAHKVGNIIYIDHIKVFEGSPNYLSILRELRKDWLPYWRPVHVVPDGTGIGRTNCELINEMVDQFPVCWMFNNKKFTRKDLIERIGFIMGDPYTRQELFQNLHNLFEHKEIALPSHMDAIREGTPGYDMYLYKNEILSVEYEQKTKFTSYSSIQEDESLDRVIATALAVYPFKDDTGTFTYHDPVFGYHGYETYREPPLETEEDIYWSKFDDWGRGRDEWLEF